MGDLFSSFSPIGAVQAGAGVLQSVIGGIQAAKAQKQLNKLISNAPKTTANQSIMDYYNKALQRYNVSPTDSLLYKNQMQNVGRNLATGLNALQSRRSVLGGIGALQRAANDAALGAGVAAENQRNASFGQLGNATTMKAADDQRVFQQNEMLPFQLRYGMLSQKAAAGNQMGNSGLSNVFGGLQNAYNMNMLNKIYKK